MFCPKCGKEYHSGAVMCEYCGKSLVETDAKAPVTPESPVISAQDPTDVFGGVPASPDKRENVFGGIVGAILGSLLGGLSIILFDQIGYVASVSGLILAFCALKGYALLGGKLTRKGIIFSIVLMLIVPYFANQISSAINFAKYVSESGGLAIPFAEAFKAVPALISKDGFDWGMYHYTLDSGKYTTGLLMIYGFAALGAFTTVRSALKNKA